MDATKPRSIDIKKKADNMAYGCQNLRVDKAAGEGASFQFNNKTRLHVQIDFLEQNLVLDPATHEVVPNLTLDPGQSSDPLLVNVDLGHGTYMYRVYLVEAQIEAEGGSRPGIEIVP